MNPIRRNIVAVTTLVGLVAMGGCQQPKSANAPPATSSSASPSPASPASGARSDAVAIRSSDRAFAIEVTRNGSEMLLTIVGNGQRTPVPTTNARGARTYQLASGSVDVKPSDSGFKLRRSDGALLWKVKLDEDKIKVSDNEENRGAWVLKTKYADKVKVLDPRETEIGEVKFYDDRGKAKVKDARDVELFESDTPRHSAALGVLLMSAVPREHQAVIVAELLGRGK